MILEEEEKTMDELDFKIVKAVNLLKRCGYTIIKPDHSPKIHYSLEGLAAAGIVLGCAVGLYAGCVVFDHSGDLITTVLNTGCMILVGFSGLIILKHDEWKEPQQEVS